MIQIDVLAPAIHDQPNFLACVSETIEYFERATRTANRVNLEGQHDQDLVRMVQSGDRDGVEVVRRVDDHVVVTLPQQLDHFVNMLGLDVFGAFGLRGRRQQ